MRRHLFVAALAVACALPAFGAGVTPDAAFEARLKTLAEELRCLVCQNQTLADSTAPLAEDLRREVRELALAGKSDAEIKEYLTARYGDFVLYKPPVKPTTWLLWFGPFAFLAGGGLIWLVVLRRRAKGDAVAAAAAAPAVDGEQAARARKLLDEEQDR